MMAGNPELEPVYIEIPLEPYCRQGRLFPSLTTQERFVGATWKLWAQVPSDHWRRRFHIFRFDFTGVTTFDPPETDTAFAFVWGNCLGQPARPVFSVFEKIAVWSQFRALMALNRHHPVIAQKYGEANYQVVGGHDKEITYGRVLPQLPRREWFRKSDLAREICGGNKEVVSDMHGDGLLLCNDIPGGREGFFYRTLV